ncbi:sigma-54 interaction domain-containing protein [Desulfitibacter alkalitolerans]|uniref:sigma-54 interaction domain-containing protein n=1 Tax=Desulfitibacter alkalitolerans TaxID=264641 RepID=UPI00047F592D|nr:sigma 54-interacting transcriptional regulator [Desulfitibacter alkalitolerans]
MSLLGNIQKDVQGVAEVIAAALKVEVEILDDDQRVLGATGRARTQLMQRSEDTYINKYVLEKAQPFILNNPGKNRLCDPCPEKDICIYTAGIFYPIITHKCIGVISLISFDSIQKEILFTNERNFVDFIARMAEFLATKVLEYQMVNELAKSKKYLETIIDSVQEGIISLDQDSKIRFFNRAAQKILGLSLPEVIGKNSSEVLPDSVSAKSIIHGISYHDEEVIYNTPNGSHTLLATSTPIIVDDLIVGSVESFTEADKIFRVASRMTNRESILDFDKIIGQSPAIKKVKAKALQAAKSTSTVLITGHSGTGKELFARAIHTSSSRGKGPFIAVNCSAIPDTLLESELFGYEKGAFTGANEKKPGKFELAQGGTFFLDEIGDMPKHLQVKLLRVIQERSFEKVGGTKTISLDFRLIAATNHNLKQLVENGMFREDLYYRLNVIPLYLPPLKERSEDIPILLAHFCNKYSSLLNKQLKGVSVDALNHLKKYPWPGNIRELENVMEYGVNFAPENEFITMEHLPPYILESSAMTQESFGTRFQDQLQKSEKEIFETAINEHGNSLEAKQKIAENFGISLSTLYRKLKKYNLL